MADGRGGYRRPINPAPVSGPGKASRRTDGGPSQPVRTLSDPAYGEQSTFRADQQSAPMATTQGATQAPQAMPTTDLSGVVPLNAPTQRPDEPVTSGAATGPGPGPASLGVGNPYSDPGTDYFYRMLPMMEIASTLPSASQEFRQMVRRMLAMR